MSNFNQTINDLAKVYDHLAGRPGAHNTLPVKGRGTIARLEAIVSGLAAHVGLDLATGGATSGAKASQPVATESAAAEGKHLAEYRRLASVDPRAAGDFYSQHAEAIVRENGQEYQRQRAEAKAARGY